MKKLLILLISLFLALTGSSQSCLPEGITFSTQAQIDSFQINYPGCTEIEGDPVIGGMGGNSITNLNGLSVLNTVGGEFEIDANWALTSLTGLESLTSIGGNLRVYGNDVLVSLQGLENLVSIG